jgi:hypothetical protein
LIGLWGQSDNGITDYGINGLMGSIGFWDQSVIGINQIMGSIRFWDQLGNGINQKMGLMS